jgi:lysophospholipase L1-like esterase
MPVDVVVIYLGTNDAGDRYSLPAETIANAVGRLVRVVRTSEAGPGGGAPEVLVVCPPPFGPLDPEGSFANAGAKSRQLGRWFAEVCGVLGCELLDLNGIASFSDVDGIHHDADGQAAVAAAVEERLRRMQV